MRATSDIGDTRLVKAFAHPLRVQILSTLEERVASPSDLAAELDAPLGNVSYHVRTLVDLGLVELVRRRTRRGAVEHYYQARGRAQVRSRQSVTLDDEGWSELSQAVARLYDEVAAIHERSGRRVADGRPAIQAGLVTMLFESQPQAAG
ncbi:MAG: hypothetical protein QOC95_2021 [Thermoleophilaceae bacterium]|jgi:DNA-binding transcriptional ArsR family regulator|nr:hypothetical protein [Thermoleophilaceae bacterium]